MLYLNSADADFEKFTAAKTQHQGLLLLLLLLRSLCMMNDRNERILYNSSVLLFFCLFRHAHWLYTYKPCFQ